MNIITKRRIFDYAKQHPNASANLSAWITVASAAKWQSIADVRKVFPHADLATVRSSKTVTIFNIAGNHQRLISAIHYNTRSIFILKILTHADYSKDRWKNDL
ncbi:MAG: type II toxin-antitoxin system HigB family toxin [Verrucomicrobia bacterium]|nr:MAG: type II toxin-antitoxin system HigB family toxin [Verrucomicrobiota bacterium]